MELNFFYAKNGRYGKITLNAEELDFTINYSQLNRYRPTAANPSSYGWLPIQNGGLRQTLPRFYGTISHKATYSVLPSSLVSKINKFNGNNTYSLDRSADFIEKDQLNRYQGLDLYVQGDEGKKKVCKFQWAVVEEDDPQHPGQKILSSYYNGLYAFACPNPDGALPTGSVVGNLSNTGGVAGKYSADAKIALWIITVHDDISGSPTYGQDFKVLVESYSQPTGFPSTGVIMADMRCLTGVENSSNIVNGSDPKKNSTPTGWGGARNTASSADTPGVAPTALKYSVNWGAGGGHGIFLYRISADNLTAFSQALWSDNFIEKFRNSKFSPASCVLAVMKLPYVAQIDTLAGGAGGQPVSVTCGGENMKEIKTKWLPSAPGHAAIHVEAKDVVARYALGGQEQPSNEVSIEPFFNSFLDFEPYTQIHIRIPFVGMVQIPTSAVMGGKLKLNWIFDNRNGNFVCQILATSMRNMEYSDADGWVIIAQYTGCCSMPMALCANDGGGMAQMSAITGFASSAVQLGVGIATGNVGAGVSGGAGMLQSAIDFAAAPHHTQLVGTVHAEASIMEDLTVRVLITRPVDVTPGIYRDEGGERVFDATSLLQQKGLAAYSGSKVNQYEGMTAGYILGNIEGATAEEMTAIRNAFLGGVIV